MVGGELGRSYAKTLPTVLSLEKKGFKAFPRLDTTQKWENDQFIWIPAFVIQLIYVCELWHLVWKTSAYVFQIANIKQIKKGCFIAQIIGSPQ